jgi:hypothetical protein
MELAGSDTEQCALEIRRCVGRSELNSPIKPAAAWVVAVQLVGRKAHTLRMTYLIFRSELNDRERNAVNLIANPNLKAKS